MNIWSNREQKILKIIGKKELTLEQISSKLFKDDKPFEDDITIANSIRRIIKKCKHHDLNWTLTKSRDGRKLLVKKENV